MKKIFSEDVDEDEDEEGKFKITLTQLTFTPENAEDEKILEEWIEDSLHIEKDVNGKEVFLLLYSKLERAP